MNLAGFDVIVIFGCSEKECMIFWLRYIWKQIILSPSRENAAQTLQKLRDDEHRIYIITGRVFVTKQGFLGWLSRRLLTSWLKRYHILYDDIYYCSEHNCEKDDSGCEKFSIDIMVEDRAENVIVLSKVTNVLRFDAAYNRNYTGVNIHRVQKWIEVYERLITWKLTC